MLVHIMKAICKNPIANIIVHGEIPKVFTLRSGTREDEHTCLFYST